MKIIIGNYQQISKQIADEFISLVKAKPNAVLGLATGTSPLEIYKNLIEANKESLERGRINLAINNIVCMT